MGIWDGVVGKIGVIQNFQISLIVVVLYYIHYKELVLHQIPQKKMIFFSFPAESKHKSLTTSVLKTKRILPLMLGGTKQVYCRMIL